MLALPRGRAALADGDEVAGVVVDEGPAWTRAATACPATDQVRHADRQRLATHARILATPAPPARYPGMVYLCSSTGLAVVWPGGALSLVVGGGVAVWTWHGRAIGVAVVGRC